MSANWENVNQAFFWLALINFFIVIVAIQVNTALQALWRYISKKRKK